MLVRPPLPKTRRWKLTNRMRNYLRGVLEPASKDRCRFQVWLCHSRWFWNKYYE